MSLEFLIEMAWKSALIAGAALGLLVLLKARAAADRAAVLRVAVGLLLLLPLFSLLLPELQVEAWTAPEPAPVSASAPILVPEMMSAAAARPSIWDDPSLLFMILYLGGVFMAAGRLATGLWTLGRWTRNARDVDCPEWNAAFERARWSAGAPQRLRLLVSDEAHSPLSWGLLRPVILIDRDTLDEPADAGAILAHEIAHVVRRDWAVLMLTRVAGALFWFNPLVRLLEREVVQQAEEAADIEAALQVEPAFYAQTLVHWAQFSSGGLVPANSIAPTPSALARRVRAILDARRRATPSGSPVTLAAIAGCTLFAVTLAALQLIPAVAQAHEIAEAPRAPAVPAALPAMAAPLAPAAPRTPATPASAPAAPRAPIAIAMAHPHPAAPLPPETPGAAPMPPRSFNPPAPPTPPSAARINAEVRAAIAASAAAVARVDVDRIVAESLRDIDVDVDHAIAEAHAAVRQVRAHKPRPRPHARARQIDIDELVEDALHDAEDDDH